MPTDVVTHSGSFHADDVLAYALLRVFYDREARVTRTRDAERIERADVVIDVGTVFDMDRRRFDHHQVSYEGNRSSAGMVLDWLEQEGHVAEPVASGLRRDLIEHVDAVDNGRTTPTRGVPCFSTIVGVYNNTAASPEEFDAQYVEASNMAVQVVEGLRAGYASVAAARDAVAAAMQDAERRRSNVMFLDSYVAWKPSYFELGGVDHPTEFVLFPADDSWRVVAIPPEPGSFANKRPLPAEWAGLTDGDLEDVVGVPGARFCHKNRFIAVFSSRDGALEALRAWGLERTTG